ncbi:hypothetical protein QL285_000833 [Trifolium repens]|nr:hypothetical protein QL285_000833 [Trifolium repens]
MDKFITLILHHGGSFERDKNRKLEYVGGEIDVWKNINPHLLNLVAIEDKVKRNRGYNNIVGLYYLKPYKGVELDMNICLCSLTTEKHCIDMLNVARMNGKVDIYFAHYIIKEHQFLPPKPQQEVIIEPAITQAGTKANDIVHHKGFQPMRCEMGDSVILGDRLSGFTSPPQMRGLTPPQMRGPVDLIPVPFSSCETGSRSWSHEPTPWHFLPPPPEFPPTRITPSSGFRSGFKSPQKKESPPPQMRGSAGLIPPAPSPNCETRSESREQEFWHFLPPPPGFKPKKIPPPPGFSGKEYI